MSKKKLVQYSIALTLLIETVCIILRYGFGLESATHTASTIGVITFGVRIHHGYIGVICLAIAFFYRKKKHIIIDLLMLSGAGLLFSDLIHHFLVLWLIEGNPQFYLLYR